MIKYSGEQNAKEFSPGSPYRILTRSLAWWRECRPREGEFGGGKTALCLALSVKNRWMGGEPGGRLASVRSSVFVLMSCYVPPKQQMNSWPGSRQLTQGLIMLLLHPTTLL